MTRAWMFGLLLSLPGAVAAQTGAPIGPLLPSGPDPWVVQRDGFYYYMHTQGDRISLWKTRDMAKLRETTPVTVWRAPASGPHSAAIWAPELHYLDGKWYLYYSGADKAHNDDAHRHVFVLENASADPTQGRWIDKGMLRTQRTGIDGTVFQHRGKLYFVYSAYVDDHSDLVIAPMRNPWTLAGPEADIAAPTFAWEMQGGRKILEAPEFLAGPAGKIFLTYSASACWSDDYAIGMLTADAGADLLEPTSWAKAPAPVVKSSPAHGVYATGHNGFFKSPDGADWIVYHANGGAGWGCSARRAPYMQRFFWGDGGVPVFGGG